MTTNSAIEWTDATWNPLAGCTPASEGCRNCYAASLAYRLERMGQAKYAGTARKVASDGRAVFTGKINLDWRALQIPFSWRAPRRVFVNSMSDLFHEAVPDDFILEVWRVMERTQRHTYQVLTKRPDRMAAFLTKRAERNPHLCPAPNIWCGTSVENQRRADERIPHLLKVPAVVRFLSCEPLLGPVDLSAWLICERCKGEGQIYVTKPTGRKSFIGYHTTCPACDGKVWRRDLHWVIVGGESGPHHRPFDPMWARRLHEDCQNAGIAFFMKQLGGPANAKGGEWEQLPPDLRVREMPQ